MKIDASSSDPRHCGNQIDLSFCRSHPANTTDDKSFVWNPEASAHCRPPPRIMSKEATHLDEIRDKQGTVAVEQSAGPIEMSAPLVRQIRLDGVIGHRSGTLAGDDIVQRWEFPCSSPLRTIIDMSGRLNRR